MNQNALKVELEKLQLAPLDIVVVKVPGPLVRKSFAKIQASLRKIIPAGQRSIVMRADMKIVTLADIITPEELHGLNVAMEQRLLAAATPLPMQTARPKKKSRRG